MVGDRHWLGSSTCLLCLVGPWYPEVSWHWCGIEGIQAKVVVRTIDVVANQPPGHASDQDVRWEVLFRQNPACAHAGRQAIDRGAGNPARIFISDYRRQGPCRSRVI